jgi:carboxyl-terminal processing protease
MASKKLGIIFLVAVLLSFALGYLSSQVLPSTPFAQQDAFGKITEQLKSSYYYDISDEDISSAYIEHLRATINTYAAIHDDPYTRLEEIPISTSPSSNESFVGLGVFFNYVNQFDVLILDVLFNGSAFGKIYPNDIVIGVVVDTNDLLFQTLAKPSDVLTLLRGELNETKTLIIKNPDHVISYVDVTYRLISTPSVSTKDLGLDVGYIKIRSFDPFIKDINPGTAATFSDILFDLEQSILLNNPEEKSLIIDLRDNPGGSLVSLHNQGDTKTGPGILQQLVVRNTERPLFQMITGSNRSTSFYGGLLEPKPYTIKILVNENSASASEVLAASLQDALGSKLYGQPTFGKQFYQNVVYLFDINQVRYNLVYTEGIWTYGNGLNVKDQPLDVILLEQPAILNYERPLYQGALKFDDVSESLIAYQHFLNHYFNLTGDDLLRTDGYFDQKTQDAFFTLQIERELTATGHLDAETSQWIFNHYMTIKHHSNYDTQLIALLNVIRNG